MNGVIGAVAEVPSYFPVTTIAALATAVAIALRVRRGTTRDDATPAARDQRWFIPLFVCGMEGMGNLSLQIRCFGPTTTAQQAHELHFAAAATMATVVFLTLAVGIAGQRDARKPATLIPPPAVFAAVASIAATWLFVFSLLPR
jgi:hypothetical protein